jgi:hypothetical protein
MTALRVRRGLSIGALVLTVCAVSASARPLARPASDPVLSAIRGVEASGAINSGQAATYRGTYLNAERQVRRLSGSSAHELGADVNIVRGIAARGALTSSRMAFVFLTLHRNVAWWSSHGPPTPGSGGEPGTKGRHCNPPAARDSRDPSEIGTRSSATTPGARAANMTFPGSGIVFEYYPGLGLQLQVNATFSSADAMLQYGNQRAAQQAGTILDQMLPLASRRAGLLTWEYEFPFEGVDPPWTSGLSQATAIDAYIRAAKRLNRPDFLKVAVRLARLFTVAPPVGVRVNLSAGPWFLLYSFDSSQLVLNADLDALIALHKLRVATGSSWVTALTHSALHSLLHYLPRFDTGSWSYYALGGPLADLNYHVLNLELTQQLCQVTGVRSVCRTARSFNRELNTRCPVVQQSADQGSSAPSASFGRHESVSGVPEQEF